MRAAGASEEIRFEKEDLPLKNYTSIHDPLSVRVLVTDEMVIVNMDLTSLPDDAVSHFQKIVEKETGIQNSYIIVSHTFSSPHIPPHVHNKMERKLSDTMYLRIDEALRKALHHACHEIHDVQIRYGEAECILNVNRNVQTSEGWWLGENPALFSNHLLQVLSFGNTSIVTYDMQSSLLNKAEGEDGGLLISSDIYGYASELLREKEKTVLFLTGCAGDQTPVKKKENLFDQRKEDGRKLAEAVEKAMDTSEEIAVDQIEQISQEWKLPGQKMKIPTKDLTPHRTYAFEKDHPVFCESTLLKAGDISLLFTMPELNSSFGSRIREITGKHTMIATLVNGGRKYLPEKEDYERITYNAMNTGIGKGSDEIFLEQVRKMKGELS